MDGQDRAPLLYALPLHRSCKTGASYKEHVLLRIRAPRRAAFELPRLTTVLVLDVSGSMQGSPLAKVKDTVNRLIDILGDDDALGIVAFSTGARTVTPIGRLRDAAARLANKQKADALLADGYTNISAGLSHAALLFLPREGGERQLVLLLSDGQPNVGTQTAAALSQEAALVKSRGVAVSTLGFGSEHNEDILMAISDAGGGRYAYVKDPLMAGPSFARALGAQRDVVLEDVQLVLSPGPGVEITRILGEARTSFVEGGLRVSLPDLLLGEEVNVVAELKVTARRDAGRFKLLRATLSGRLSMTSRENLSLQKDASVDLVNGEPDAEKAKDPAVQEVVVVATAAEARQEARRLADQRNFVGAAARLKQAKEAILAVHGGVPEDGTALRDMYETILDDLQIAEKAPPPEEYSIHRKAQFDQQTFATGINRAGTGLTPSAQHMVLKLRGTHGAVARARLVCVDGGDRGRVIELASECRIGRASDNDFALKDPSATRYHTLIQWIGRGFFAHDLGSSGGTFVNDRLIVDDHELKDGDVLRVGKSRLRFEALDKKDP
jgi:Ca-activated chloride channel family protein